LTSFDLIVVGLGSAGMTAAQGAPRFGLRTAGVERARVGGDCLWTGCVPSKALIASARLAHRMRTADRLGLEPFDAPVDTSRVWARVRAVQEDIAATSDSPQRFREAGVEVVEGASARLAVGRGGSGRSAGAEPPPTVEVGGRTLETRHVLICTGSRPASPPVEGLEEAGFLTSETLFTLERAPRSIVVLGGGPIAIEMAQALVRLGVEVTVLEMGDGILSRDEPELASRVAARLRAEGVSLHTATAAQRVTLDGDGTKRVHAGERSFAADELLVAAGRAPNVEGLGLEEAGVAVGPEGIVVDDRLRTSRRGVWAAGDVTGGPLFTHAAGFDAARAVRNMAFPGSSGPADEVPWTTFTDPELAHVGLTAAQACERHGDGAVEVHRMELADSDRARAEEATDGAILVVTAKGRIVGAHVLAPAAGEVIHELALALRQGLDLHELAGMIHVYPTYALDLQRLAGEAAYARGEKVRFLTRLTR
jgi:pyruvate/2-oxoglutarate dehydrogenase complex dihydrolipoamide dehydrogenase (E3) component